MAEQKLSRLKLPGSTDTYIIDAEYFAGKTENQWIEEINKKTTGSVDYLGTVSSSTDLTGKAPNSVGDFVRVLAAFTVPAANSATGAAVSVHAGDLLICESLTGPTYSVVHGEEGNLISHKHKYTPKGTVSQPTFTGTAASHNHTFSGSQTTVTVASSGDATYTPSGSVEAPTFTGTAVTSGTPSANATVASSNHTHTIGISKTSTTGTEYTPEGTISVTVTGTSAGSINSASITPKGTNSSTSITPTGTISTGTIGSGESANYTPAGTVSGGGHTHKFSASYTPAGTVAGHTHTVSSSTASATLVSELTQSYDSDTKTLTLQTSTASISYVSKVSSPTSSTAPAFTGTGATISGTTESTTPTMSFSGTGAKLIFTGTAASHTHTFTGTAASHTHTFTGGTASLGGEAIFTGTPVYLTTGSPSATATVASNTHTHSVTAKGTISTPTFTGTGIRLVTTAAGTISSTEITPAGEVSQPTFSGTTDSTGTPE